MVEDITMVITRIIIIPILILASNFSCSAEGASNPMMGPRFTPRLNYWWSPITFQMSPKLRAFLDEGLEHLGCSSLLDNRQIVLAASAIIHNSLKYDDCFMRDAPHDLDDVLQNGGGSCLDLSFILATLLSESGLRLNLVKREPAGEVGHIWLENGEGPQALVIDATRPQFAETMESLKSSYEGLDDTFASKWYLHRDRTYHKVQ